MGTMWLLSFHALERLLLMCVLRAMSWLLYCCCVGFCRYSMSGKRNTLVLHCSLQRATGRMLVHTVEVNNDKNTHVSKATVGAEYTHPTPRVFDDVSECAPACVCISKVPAQHAVGPLNPLAGQYT